jgi:O-antigen/teichoic acid export membrane protein
LDKLGSQRRGTKALFAANVTSQVFGLLRFVLLARLLGPEQLGFAATLILTQSFFDFATDLAADRFLIQDKDGNEASVQNFVQFVLVGRGAFIAVGLVLSAWPLAYFYKAPQLAPALAALAFYPLILAFAHLDRRRFQRWHDFRAEAWSTLISEGAGLIATVLAAYFTHSYVAVLYGLVTKAVVLVIVTHLQAERPYGLKFYKEHSVRMARFSAPLVLTGIILFFANQGDRILVTRSIGFAGLGYYSAVILLIYNPSSMLHGFVHAMYLPLIAGARGDHARRSAISARLGSETVLLALCMAAGFAIVAPIAIPILYGHRFEQSVITVALIGILQCTRYLSVWFATVGLAMGRSGIVLANNVVRLIAWPAAIFGVMMGAGLIGIVIGFIFGELIAAAWALVMLNRSESNNILQGFGRLALFVSGSAVIVAWVLLLTPFSIGHFLILLIITSALLAWIGLSEERTICNALSLTRRLAGA